MYKRIILYIARAMSKINQIFADTSSTVHVVVVTTRMVMSFRGRCISNYKSTSHVESFGLWLFKFKVISNK